MPSLVVVSGKITLFIQFAIMHILQFFLPFMFLLQTIDIYSSNFYIGGSSLNNLIELKAININPTDTNALLLNDCTEVGCLPISIII